MATEPAPQRAWRAACPGCGAPVDFRSLAAPFAVCAFCRSVVVRDGEALRRIGESAELFDDHSPLRIGAAGRYQGTPFTLAGRLQFGYADGTWNEWHALFEAGDGALRSGWLSDDNGRYVVAFDTPLRDAVPPPERLQPGAPLGVDGERWIVASVVEATLAAAEGELPTQPPLGRSFVVADLRSPNADDVGTLDYADPARPGWSRGRAVALADLGLAGLGEAVEKTLSGRGFACPNCGASLTVSLETTQSIVCAQCKSVIDVSQGVGGDLAHYAQAGGSEPQIPLGSVGTFAFDGAPLPWQVVGYVERREVPQDDEDEQTFWREYLLYRRGTGFAFLVDADDGWSWAVPATGAPDGSGDTVRFRSATYRKKYDYTGEITYVVGEFYWRLQRGERTTNSDYEGTGGDAARRLNRERTTGAGIEEVVWSAGATLPSETVRSAFRLPPEQARALARDAAPTAFSGASTIVKIVIVVVLVVFILAFVRCSGGPSAADCREARQLYGEASREYQNCLASRRRTGGSYGGFSTGGGHK